MERDGLLTRTAYDENPPRVEYELTALGRTLLTLVAAARAWSKAHLPALLAARDTYDSSPAASRRLHRTDDVPSESDPSPHP